MFVTFVCLEADTPSVHGTDDATFCLLANHFLPAKKGEQTVSESIGTFIRETA